MLKLRVKRFYKILVFRKTLSFCGFSLYRQRCSNPLTYCKNSKKKYREKGTGGHHADVPVKLMTPYISFLKSQINEKSQLSVIFFSFFGNVTRNMEIDILQ